MKLLRISLIGLVALATVLGSCKKARIYKDFTGGEVVFMIDPQSAGTYDETSTVKFNLQDEMDKLGINSNRIKSLKIKSLTFILNDTTPTPVTFDIADNATTEVGTATKAMSKLAWKDPIPHTGLTQVEADVDPTIDVLGMAKEGDVIYHLFGTLNTPLTHPVDIKAKITWTVEAGL